jgi:hypothetical protein
VNGQVLIVGHSHIRALLGGARALGLPWTALHLAVQRHGYSHATRKFTAEFESKFHSAREGCSQIVSCVGGNTHNIVGLVEHPRPFDFVLRENPDLPLRRDAEVVPPGIIESRLEHYLLAHLRVIDALHRLSDLPMTHVESPPPIPSDTFLREHAGIFKSAAAERGFAPKWLRYKLWALCGRVIRQHCDAHAIGYISTPRSVMDADGFLVPEAWANDPTHGNSWYGKQVVGAIDATNGSN